MSPCRGVYYKKEENNLGKTLVILERKFEKTGGPNTRTACGRFPCPGTARTAPSGRSTKPERISPESTGEPRRTARRRSALPWS
jgi:hypothetical protein